MELVKDDPLKSIMIARDEYYMAQHYGPRERCLSEDFAYGTRPALKPPHL